MHISYNVMGKRRSKSATVMKVVLPAAGGSVALRGGDIATLGGAVTLQWGESTTDIVTVSPGSGLGSTDDIVVTTTANTWGVSRVMDIYFECTLYSGLYATFRLSQGAGSGGGVDPGPDPGPDPDPTPPQDRDVDFYWVSLSDVELLFDGEPPATHTFDGVSTTDVYVRCSGAALVHTHYHVDGATGESELMVVEKTPLEGTDKVALGLGFALSENAKGAYPTVGAGMFARTFYATTNMYTYTHESILSGKVAISALQAGHTFTITLIGAYPFKAVSAGDTLCWLGASYGPEPIDVALAMHDLTVEATYPVSGGVVSFTETGSLSDISSQYISGAYTCGAFAPNYMTGQVWDHSDIPAEVTIESKEGAESVEISWSECCKVMGIEPPQAVWQYRWGGSLPAEYPLLQLREIEPLPAWISNTFADITEYMYSSVAEVQELCDFPYSRPGETAADGFGVSWVQFVDRNLSGEERVWSVEVVDLFTQEVVTTLHVKQA